MIDFKATVIQLPDVFSGISPEQQGEALRKAIDLVPEIAYVEKFGRPMADYFKAWTTAIVDDIRQENEDAVAFDVNVLKDFADTMNAPVCGKRIARRRLIEKKRNYWHRFRCWVDSGKLYITHSHIEPTIVRDCHVEFDSSFGSGERTS